MTGLAALGDGDGQTMTSHDGIAEEKFACATPATATAIVLHMPSGQTFTDITDEEGISRVRIPDTEPYRGVVKVTANTAVTELRYTRAMPAMTAVRETVMTCSAVHHVTGALEVELGIDDEGHPVRIGVDRGDASFARCMNDGIANVRFGEGQRGVKLSIPFELPG